MGARRKLMLREHLVPTVRTKRSKQAVSRHTKGSGAGRGYDGLILQSKRGRPGRSERADDTSGQRPDLIYDISSRKEFLGESGGEAKTIRSSHGHELRNDGAKGKARPPYEIPRIVLRGLQNGGPKRKRRPMEQGSRTAQDKSRLRQRNRRPGLKDRTEWGKFKEPGTVRGWDQR